MPLDTFVAYGQWFQSAADLDVEEVLVTGVSPAGNGYELTLGDGETLRARQVVVAVGVEHFSYVPSELAGLPATACTHSSAHTDLAAFAGQRVIVVGAGQSALESAALLHEYGAQVQIVMREQNVAWNGAPLPPDRPLLQRLREPEAGLGSGWGTWFYSTQPGVFRHLPEAAGCTGPGPSSAPPGPAGCAAGSRASSRSSPATRWIGRRPGPSGVRLGLGTATRVAQREVAADHVIAATGYRPDLGRLTFLDEEPAGPAADRGQHPRGEPGLPDQRPRALRGRPGSGPHVWPGHALRVRRGPRGPDRGPAAGQLVRPPGRRGRGSRPVSVPQTGERAWAVGPGERPVRVSLGHANAPASTVSVPQTGERAWAVGPGERPVSVSPGAVRVPGNTHRAGSGVRPPRPAGPGRVRPGSPALPPPVEVPAQVTAAQRITPGAIAAAVAMPLADVAALGAVLASTAMSTAFPAAAWAYAALVFVALSVGDLHRLRICLRVADQAGRIIAAAALPAVALLPWLTAGQAFRLAVTAATLLIVARVVVSAGLRAAHRRGRPPSRPWWPATARRPWSWPGSCMSTLSWDCVPWTSWTTPPGPVPGSAG